MGKVGHVWRHPICTSITTTQPQKQWKSIHFLAHERILHLLDGHIIWNWRDIRYTCPLIITYFYTFEWTAPIRWQLSQPIRVRVGLNVALTSPDSYMLQIDFFVLIDFLNEKLTDMDNFYIKWKLLKNAKWWCMLRVFNNKITVGDRWFRNAKLWSVSWWNVESNTETNRNEYT